jgi:hypothetical protein
MVLKVPMVERLFQPCEELATEDTAEDFDGQEEGAL